MASHRRIVTEAKHEQFKVVGVGSFGDVYRVADTEIAFKIPFEKEEAEQATEEQIYSRLGTSHPFILRSYGEAESPISGDQVSTAQQLSYQHRHDIQDPSLAERMLDQTETDDIFALGTVIYEISVGHRLYADKSDSEIYQLIQKREFPDTAGLAFRTVIDKCWRNQYRSAEEVTLDLASERPTRQSLLQYFGLSLGVLLVIIAIGRSSTRLSKR
ncbi:hypothetical protein IFR05_014776 [Cadophora sp. M221]|nr:hypothetical protein IFR05_014776 [Cadophora sp. M221]